MCIFCQIVNREIPAKIVYEDADTLAFLDIKPVNPGHILVIPKKHYQNLEEAPIEELQKIIVTVKKMGALLKEKLEITGYNVIENNDPVAGQITPHLHFHVIPRHSGDGNALWDQRDYQSGEAEEIMKKLTS